LFLTSIVIGLAIGILDYSGALDGMYKNADNIIMWYTPNIYTLPIIY